MLSGKIIKQFLVKLPTIQGCVVSRLLFGISQDILDKKQENNEVQMPKWKRERAQLPVSLGEWRTYQTAWRQYKNKTKSPDLGKGAFRQMKHESKSFSFCVQGKAWLPGWYPQMWDPRPWTDGWVTTRQQAWWGWLRWGDQPGLSRQAQWNNKDFYKTGLALKTGDVKPAVGGGVESGSVGEVFAVKTWEPQFRSPAST